MGACKQSVVFGVGVISVRGGVTALFGLVSEAIIWYDDQQKLLLVIFVILEPAPAAGQPYGVQRGGESGVRV
jgi:hypothetical protein